MFLMKLSFKLLVGIVKIHYMIIVIEKSIQEMRDIYQNVLRTAMVNLIFTEINYQKIHKRDILK